MLAGAHEGELDLVLDVFDVQSAGAVGGATTQGLDDVVGEGLDGFMDAARRGGAGAFDRDKGFGERAGDLGRVKRRELTVAADYLQTGRTGGRAVTRCLAGLVLFGLVWV